jgi:hypothetical protein
MVKNHLRLLRLWSPASQSSLAGNHYPLITSKRAILEKCSCFSAALTMGFCSLASCLRPDHMRVSKHAVCSRGCGGSVWTLPKDQRCGSGRGKLMADRRRLGDERKYTRDQPVQGKKKYRHILEPQVILFNAMWNTQLKRKC